MSTTENDIFTQTILFLVHEPMVAFKVGRYPVNKIVNQFPVGERGKIKDGIDAVVELGFFVMDGSDIQLTDKGEMLFQALFEVSKMSADERHELANTSPKFAALLTAIQLDSRLTPPPVSSVATVNSSTTSHSEQIMRISLRKVGNSRGVIIPATLLAACEMGDEVDIRLEGKNLVIAPIKAPRAGWFEGYKPKADSEPLAALPADEGSEDWVW